MKTQSWMWAITGVLMLFPAGPLPAAEVTVQNDTIGSQVPVGDFAIGEQAGARLTASCDGTIVAVQIVWAGYDPAAGQSIQQAIHIFNGATFPVPGAELAYLEAPLLTPGFINEFRYLDEAQTIPLNVPVTQGQQFYVTLEFAEPTDVQQPPFGQGTPSVVRDVDGCQAGKNVIYGDIGAGNNWYNLCSLQSPGYRGDLAIRAVIDCAEPTGACCNATGVCASDVRQSDCQAYGDVWTQGQTCAQVSCLPRGACCRAGGCLQLVSQATCEGVLAGVYAGNGTNCNDNVCVAGACCLPVGDCLVNFAVQCAGVGGTFGGPGTTCSPNPCPQPDGACCFGDFCLDAQTRPDCEGSAGSWAGPFTACFTGLCPVCDNGDADGDADVDLVDFAKFQGCFTCTSCGGGSCKCLDMDNDNDVDLTDFELFHQALEASSPH